MKYFVFITFFFSFRIDYANAKLYILSYFPVRQRRFWQGCTFQYRLAWTIAVQILVQKFDIQVTLKTCRGSVHGSIEDFYLTPKIVQKLKIVKTKRLHFAYMYLKAHIFYLATVNPLPPRAPFVKGNKTTCKVDNSQMAIIQASLQHFFFSLIFFFLSWEIDRFVIQFVAAAIYSNSGV